MDILYQFGLHFMAFFAIMNPISSLPVYISLTEADNSATAKKVAQKGLLIAFGIVVTFACTGQLIFALFDITLPALRVAGGLLIFLIGFHMVQGKQSPTHTSHARIDQLQHEDDDNLNVAISPLGTPLLAGPGTIATAMSLTQHYSFVSVSITITSFGLLCIITYILFIYGKRIVAVIGKSIMNIITRLMGLILAVIGTQMVIEGIHGAFFSVTQ